MDQALFEADGDRWVPSPATAGPWDPNAQHGGPPAALLARLVERADAPVPQRVVRIAYELLGPVPIVPLTAAVEVVRQGKRVSVVDATLLADGKPVMRATAQRVRLDDQPVPPELYPDDPPPPGPDSGTPPVVWDREGSFTNAGVEMRFVQGGFEQQGPGTAWIRLRVPLVAGEETSPLCRAAAAADFANGISSILKVADWLFLNPELTLTLARPPEGEWICLQAVTHPSDLGSGFAESAIYDTRGRVGRGTQTLLLERRR